VFFCQVAFDNVTLYSLVVHNTAKIIHSKNLSLCSSLGLGLDDLSQENLNLFNLWWWWNPQKSETQNSNFFFSADSRTCRVFESL